MLPVFLLLVFGLLDVGRLVYTNAALSQAAREGARLAATEAARIGQVQGACVDAPGEITVTNPGAYVCPPLARDFKDHVVQAVNRMTVALGPVNAVHVSCNVGGSGDPLPSGPWSEGAEGNGCDRPINTPGELVSVRVEYVYQPMTPGIAALIGPVPLSGSATMVIH